MADEQLKRPPIQTRDAPQSASDKIRNFLSQPVRLQGMSLDVTVYQALSRHIIPKHLQSDKPRVREMANRLNSHLQGAMEAAATGTSLAPVVGYASPFSYHNAGEINLGLADLAKAICGGYTIETNEMDADLSTILDKYRAHMDNNVRHAMT